MSLATTDDCSVQGMHFQSCRKFQGQSQTTAQHHPLEQVDQTWTIKGEQPDCHHTRSKESGDARGVRLMNKENK